MLENCQRLLPVALLALTALSATAASAPRFTGEQSCASSYCHGGGKDHDQFQIFHKSDIHTRVQEYLATNRSTQIGNTLGITDVTKDARCTVCHSPQEGLPADRFLAGAKPVQGLACETCHGPAENYVRFHTRLDISHEQRVGAGLRDVHGLYSRSNVCIACHLNIDEKYITAGHPELFFELDGQMSEKKVFVPHWKLEKDDWLGPRTWLVGQAAVLRELSWKLTTQASEDLVARWKGLRWLLKQIPAASGLPYDQVDNYPATQGAADRLARQAAKETWNKDSTMTALKKLVALGNDFADANVSKAEHRRRAEVLVPAIDRMWRPLKAAGVKSDNFEKLLGTAADEGKKQRLFEPDRFATPLHLMEAEMELMQK